MLDDAARSVLEQITTATLAEVTALAAEQEKLEGWIMGEVSKGLPLPGLYPPDAGTRARYEAETKKSPNR